MYLHMEEREKKCLRGGLRRRTNTRMQCLLSIRMMTDFFSIYFMIEVQFCRVRTAYVCLFCPKTFRIATTCARSSLQMNTIPIFVWTLENSASAKCAPLEIARDVQKICCPIRQFEEFENGCERKIYKINGCEVWSCFVMTRKSEPELQSSLNSLYRTILSLAGPLLGRIMFNRILQNTFLGTMLEQQVSLATRSESMCLEKILFNFTLHHSRSDKGRNEALLFSSLVSTRRKYIHQWIQYPIDFNPGEWNFITFTRMWSALSAWAFVFWCQFPVELENARSHSNMSALHALDWMQKQRCPVPTTYTTLTAQCSPNRKWNANEKWNGKQMQHAFVGHLTAELIRRNEENEIKCHSDLHRASLCIRIANTCANSSMFLNKLFIKRFGRTLRCCVRRMTSQKPKKWRKKRNNPVKKWLLCSVLVLGALSSHTTIDAYVAHKWNAECRMRHSVQHNEICEQNHTNDQRIRKRKQISSLAVCSLLEHGHYYYYYYHYIVLWMRPGDGALKCAYVKRRMYNGCAVCSW